jgi:uncharacterized membrane protein YeaQ/YmgE (transglycosylase-associated protein family)
VLAEGSLFCLDSLAGQSPAKQISLEREKKMGSLIWTIVIGFVVGLIARALKPGNDSLGIVMTSILGIVGAYAASFVGKTMGWYAEGEAAGFIAAVVGAVVLLFIVGMIKKK